MLFQRIFRNMDSCISPFPPSQISLVLLLNHISFLISSFPYIPSHSFFSSSHLYFHFDCCKHFYTYYSPEFIGRIPRIVPLHPLTENDLVRIIQDPEDSLLSQVPHLTSITLLRILRIKVDSSINDYSV